MRDNGFKMTYWSSDLTKRKFSKLIEQTIIFEDTLILLWSANHPSRLFLQVFGAISSVSDADAQVSSKRATWCWMRLSVLDIIGLKDQDHGKFGVLVIGIIRIIVIGLLGIMESYILWNGV